MPIVNSDTVYFTRIQISMVGFTFVYYALISKLLLAVLKTRITQTGVKLQNRCTYFHKRKLLIWKKKLKLNSFSVLFLFLLRL